MIIQIEPNNNIEEILSECNYTPKKKDTHMVSFSEYMNIIVEVQILSRLLNRKWKKISNINGQFTQNLICLHCHNIKDP